jgi:predicted Zn-dependent protease
MSSLLNACSKEMKVDERIINRIAFAIFEDVTVEFVSTNGSEFTQHFSKVMSRLNALAQVGSNTQTRSTEFQVGQGGLELFNKDKMLAGANRITKEVLELIEAPECPTDTRDVIISPDQMYLQIHESIGHALELDRILGDERNYAGWSFVNLSDFGKLQYGSPLLNVTFDPTVSGEFASYNFDDTGAKATREFLIQDGILKRGIGGVESQARANVKGVSSMRSTNWNRAPIDRMGNINLEPGTSSLDDMISATEKGIMMMTNRSWSIDDYRKKFQFGCEYARLIENGKLTTVVKNPNYKGISIPFWNSLKMVGNQDSFELRGSPYCGKGEPNQIIWVGHATPACLFSNLEIFGGAK